MSMVSVFFFFLFRADSEVSSCQLHTWAGARYEDFPRVTNILVEQLFRNSSPDVVVIVVAVDVVDVTTECASPAVCECRLLSFADSRPYHSRSRRAARFD